jgi:hypothetical protein
MSVNENVSQEIPPQAVDDEPMNIDEAVDMNNYDNYDDSNNANVDQDMLDEPIDNYSSHVEQSANNEMEANDGEI